MNWRDRYTKNDSVVISGTGNLGILCFLSICTFHQLPKSHCCWHDLMMGLWIAICCVTSPPGEKGPWPLHLTDISGGFRTVESISGRLRLCSLAQLCSLVPSVPRAGYSLCWNEAEIWALWAGYHACSNMEPEACMYGRIEDPQPWGRVRGLHTLTHTLPSG